jgi:hypothetical protein
MTKTTFFCFVKILKMQSNNLNIDTYLDTILQFEYLEKLILGIMGEYEGVPRSNISKTNPYA